MAYSISNNEQVGYAVESTWGTVPAANPLKLLRATKFDFKAETTSTQSEEIVTSREVADLIRTERMGNGTVDWELSYGMLDDMLEGLFGGTWTANVLKVGATNRSFTFERQTTDIAQFETYAGGILTGMKLNLAIGKVIDGSLSFTSKMPTIAGATGLTGTTAAPTNVVMNPIDHIQLMQEGGAGSITGVAGMSIEWKSEGVRYPQINALDAATIKMGRFEASGSIDIYWQDATYLTKYLAWTTTSLAVTLGGSAALKYAIVLPKVKLTGAGTPNPGINQPLVSKFTFGTFKDATDSTTKITRTP